MHEDVRPEAATLLDVLIDGFMKNEVFDGYHWRELPLPDEVTAIRKFNELVGEARRWKGRPTRIQSQPRRLVAWPDLDIRQGGRAILVRVRAPRFYDWWHDPATWDGDPMAPLFRWVDDELSAAHRSRR